MVRTKYNFSKYEKLIYKIAWSFHKTTGIAIEELFSEACLSYCESLNKWDITRGKLTTFLWVSIQNHLRNYIDKNYKRQPQLLSIDLQKNDKYYSIENFFDCLSPEAEQIAIMILSNPKPFITQRSKKAIKRTATIMQNKGWAMDRIWIAIKELKSVFS